jgi:hypothetical protein
MHGALGTSPAKVAKENMGNDVPRLEIKTQN